MNSIGGYFELELRKGVEFHAKAIALNTARNALELILKVKRYTKVYIPYFTCDVILEPFKKTKTPFEFYKVDKRLDPVFQKKVRINEGFLYTNYFGIKDKTVKNLTKLLPDNLIIDNSQSFFSLPEKGVPTFYSCRKFFGLPDGAYLYLDDNTVVNLPIDHSEGRFSHLLKRIEYGPASGYMDFKANDENFIDQPIKQMSKITKALLCNIDYNFVKKKRKENFSVLTKHLSKYNKFKITLLEKSVPMVYPFLTNKEGLRTELIKNNIFVATYWPNVFTWISKHSIEFNYASQIVHLPVDQRYSDLNMYQIINQIKKFYGISD